VKKSNVQGTTICYKGKLIGCVWDKSLKKFTEFPKLLACVQAHEDLHVKQAAPYKPCDCRPKDIFAPPGNAKDECEAYSAEETCLKKAMLDDCNSAYDPAVDYYVCDDCTTCEIIYGLELMNVIWNKNSACGKSGIK